MSESMRLPTGLLRRASNVLHLHPTLSLFLMLTPPLLWFGGVYVGSLLTLLSQSVFTFDDMTHLKTVALHINNLK